MGKTLPPPPSWMSSLSSGRVSKVLVALVWEGDVWIRKQPEGIKHGQRPGSRGWRPTLGVLPAALCPAIALLGDRLPFGARSDERGLGLWECKTYPYKVWNIRNVRQRLLPSSCTTDQLSASFLRST